MSEKRIQQQLYTRERGGIFHATDGYDTIAISSGLDKNYVKKYVHPICVYDAPNSLKTGGEKDISQYPNALTIIQPETGELIIGQSIFVPSDFTGQRSTFFMHNYIVPPNRKEDWIKHPEKVFQINSFKESYDLKNGHELEELNNIPAGSMDIFEKKNDLLQKIGVTEIIFKQLLFAVISSVSGKKKVFISLDVALQEQSETAASLLELLFHYLPYAIRRKLGVTTFSNEPESKKYIHIIFVEPGSLHSTDRSFEKQFIFDFPNNRITGVEVEGHKHEYLEYAWQNIIHSKRLDSFFEFAQDALEGLDEQQSVEISSYYQLTAIYHTCLGDFSFFERNKMGMLHSFLKYIQTVSIKNKQLLIANFLKLLQREEKAADPETAIEFFNCLIEFNKIYPNHLFTNQFIAKTIEFYREKTLSLFNELMNTLEKDKHIHKQILEYLASEKHQSNLDVYFIEKFNMLGGSEETIHFFKNILSIAPIFIKSKSFLRKTVEKLVSTVARNQNPLESAWSIQKSLKGYQIAGYELEFNRFQEIMDEQIENVVLQNLKIEQVLIRDIEKFGKIFRNKQGNEKVPLSERTENLVIMNNLYDVFFYKKTDDQHDFESMTSRARLKFQNELKRILKDEISIENFSKILIAFDKGDQNYDFVELFDYISTSANEKLIVSFIKWSSKKFRDQRYITGLKRYLISHPNSVWGNKEARKELKNIPALKRVIKEVELETANPIIKFIRKNTIGISLTIGILSLTGAVSYIIFSPNEEKPLKAEEAAVVQATPFVLADKLQVPWSIQKFNDTFYLSERTGSIVKVENGQKTRQNVNLDRPLSNVSEAGFLGFVLDPDFQENQQAYAYYTYDDNGVPFNRVVILTLMDGTWNETKLLLDGIPSGNVHHGGRLKIGPDELLYITAGDASDPDNAQDLQSLNGKILRMNLDGSIPSDNPFSNSFIYSYGHRNPQGLAWDESGTLYESEHGQSAHDEINIINAGANYGWPIIEGDDKQQGMETPLFQTGKVTWAPSGIAFHDNKLYVASLHGKALQEFDLATKKSREVITGLGRIRDVLIDGEYVYFVSNNTDGRGNPAEDDDKLYQIRLSELK